ncbi:MAG: multidrug transporter [Pseudomonas sp.]|uniref:multidrug transporter n=1 Tax=Pseudomonas sp. TaxID=306 RepID=UPI002736AD82|nr:multidrug transporter [Pseudomonas sp.]MDP3847132.1 multidrug transporter [Pseudomonas sp.]
MNLFRTTAALLALTTGLLALPAQAEEVPQATTNGASGDPLYAVQAPKGYVMMGDLIFARPLLITATAIGAVAFVISLPFTLASGGVKDAGTALVVEPGREAFVRCLGCDTSGYQHN